MDLEGHSHITRIAIKQLEVTSNAHPYIMALNQNEIRRAVVLRDVADVLNYNHWKTWDSKKQRHHFMRANGQSQYEAYNSCVNWINQNAQKAQRNFQLYANSTKLKMYKNYSSYDLPDVVLRDNSRFSFGKDTPNIFRIYSPSISSKPLGKIENIRDYAANAVTPYIMDIWNLHRQGILLYRIILNLFGTKTPLPIATLINPALRTKGWKYLGYALHALQDSFAEGHVKREKDENQYPNKIKKILLYAGKEAEGHEELDTKWKTPNASLSISGWVAVEASKDLIHAILFSVITGHDFDLLFKSFKDKHLAVSPSLKEKWHIKQVYKTGISIPLPASPYLLPPLIY